MKKITLDQTHEALGAKMVDFAGFKMPLQYEGLKAEHLHVRAKVGIFDVSHMGEIFVSGAKAQPFLQKLTSNDISKLSPGKVQYSCLPNDRGGIVDDLLVYCMAENEYLLVVNASNIQKDLEWLQTHGMDQALIKDESDAYSLFAVQGPEAVEALQPLTDLDLADMKYYTFDQGKFAGRDKVIVSATGYTGAGGFEIYVRNEDAQHVWDAIMKEGSRMGIKPIGLAARDTLRMEKGFCLYGNDIDDTTSPLEAGLGWITKLDTDFIHAKELAAQKEAGLDRRLVGFVMQERGIPRQGYLLKDGEGAVIGEVTSGTQSPSMDKAIGLGYVQIKHKAPGSEIFVEIRNKPVKAQVEKLPLYKG